MDENNTIDQMDNKELKLIHQVCFENCIIKLFQLLYSTFL